MEANLWDIGRICSHCTWFCGPLSMTFRRMLHFFPLLKFGTDAFFRVHFADNRELILKLFLSQGRKPQVSIPHARTVVSCERDC